MRSCLVSTNMLGGGRVVRWCWVNFWCRGVLLIWIIAGQGPTALAVGAGGGCLDIFSLFYHFSFLSPSLWKTVRYRLKYCLKGPLSPKQPTNQPTCLHTRFSTHLLGYRAIAKNLSLTSPLSYKHVELRLKELKI